MKKSLLKRLLFIVPIFILIIMLFLINNTINYFKDTTYAFVYDTNKGGVERFAKEIDILISEGYSGKEYDAFYLSMIKAHSKTNGEKYAIVSFLLSEDLDIYYGDEASQLYVSALLNDPNNENAIKNIATLHNTGEITLNNHGKGQTWFYQLINDGDKDYYEFMSVDKTQIELNLDENKIVIPIVIIGLLLVITIEYSIWIKMFCDTCRDKKGKIKCK